MIHIVLNNTLLEAFESHKLKSKEKKGRCNNPTPFAKNFALCSIVLHYTLYAHHCEMRIIKKNFNKSINLQEKILLS